MRFGLYAWLRNLNLDRNIDFLAISSIATLFGSHSQAGYVMANGYVQGLMQHRRAKGLRGCVLARSNIIYEKCSRSHEIMLF